jgi:hypothetical protein
MHAIRTLALAELLTRKERLTHADSLLISWLVPGWTFPALLRFDQGD